MASKPDKPHFPNPMLHLGMTIERTNLGRALMDPFTKSSAPNVVKAEWHANVTAVALDWIRLSGDTQAGWLPRNWNRGMVMSTTEEEIARFEDTYRNYDIREAVAFRSDNEVHVGVRPGQVSLFGRLLVHPHHGEWAAGLRRGRGPLEAHMGIWLPEEEAFIGARALHLVYESLHTSEFKPQSILASRVPLVT